MVEVVSKPKSKWRPLPLDTVVRLHCARRTDLREALNRCFSPHSQILLFFFWLFPTQELEKLASRKLKINAKETMRIAEKLYTQG